jgi:hypothetical protein
LKIAGKEVCDPVHLAIRHRGLTKRWPKTVRRALKEGEVGGKLVRPRSNSLEFLKNHLDIGRLPLGQSVARETPQTLWRAGETFGQG